MCTLYPMPGYFIALIVIGAKEEPESSLLIPAFGDYMRALYGQSVFSLGGKWLMVHITNEHILRDAQALIKLRVKSKS